jgi:hypothetical protein
MATDKQCAHKGCTCMAKTDSKFCSQFCEDSAGVETLTCGCGHPGCAADKL